MQVNAQEAADELREIAYEKKEFNLGYLVAATRLLERQEDALNELTDVLKTILEEEEISDYRKGRIEQLLDL